jgi:hypothetical protein
VLTPFGQTGNRLPVIQNRRSGHRCAAHHHRWHFAPNQDVEAFLGQRR